MWTTETSPEDQKKAAVWAQIVTDDRDASWSHPCLSMKSVAVYSEYEKDQTDHEKHGRMMLFLCPSMCSVVIRFPNSGYSRRPKFGNSRINPSLMTISANQPSIVLVRAARRRYRLYHQQPVINAPLTPHGAAIKLRRRWTLTRST